MQVNQLAWRLGVPFIDAGGHADGKLVRLTTIAPRRDQACFECSWDDGDYAEMEQRLPCLGLSRASAPPSHSPACLGSLCASVQVLFATSLLTDPAQSSLPARQLVLDATSRRLYDSHLPQRDSCRFDHQLWRIEPLSKLPTQLTLREALRLRSPGRTCAVALRVEPGLFARTLACKCGRRRDVLLLSGRGSRSAMRCPRCGRRMHALNVGTTSRLHADELSHTELSLPMSRLGFRPGDIFGVGSRGAETHYQLPLE